VALGDSFTEGLDDYLPDGTPRGWADRVAEHLAIDNPELRYANLAVRGKLLDEIVEEQIPVAEQTRPDLITFCGGGNDILRPTCDTDDLAARFDAALARVCATGATVLTFTGFDLARMHPLLRRLRGRVACYNEMIRASAERHGALVVDLWGMAPLGDPRTWGPDRVHLRADGHRRVALRVLETLGEPINDDWRTPLPAPEPVPWLARQQEDLRWLKESVLPFIKRHLLGLGGPRKHVAPKRPELAPVNPLDPLPH
jgi:Lysophospholipase L1 and related esterases